MVETFNFPQYTDEEKKTIKTVSLSNLPNTTHPVLTKVRLKPLPEVSKTAYLLDTASWLIVISTHVNTGHVT